MDAKWKNYLDTIDGHEVSILVDLTFEQHAPPEELPNLVFLGLKIVDPTDRGFPTKDEWSKLGAIEDAVSARLATDQAHQQCGSLMTSGVRTLYFYSSAPSRLIGQIDDVLTAFPGREYQTGDDPDPEWEFYREVLLPDDRQRHCIEDHKVLEVLKANGDGLRQAREIDHWVDFPDADSRREFEKRAHGLGFQTRGLLDPDDEPGDFGIQLWREDIPSYGTIELVSLALYDLAVEMGGEYDGWETYVVEG